MNKLLVFDLDGVLADLKLVHFRALNAALASCGHKPISYEDHLANFDGLPTAKKLYMLDLSAEQIVAVSEIKQKATLQAIDELIEPNQSLVELFHEIISAGFMIVVCSNARFETVEKCLDKLGLIYLIAFVETPDLGRDPKPSPKMLLELMRKSGACPRTTLVFEDAPSGLLAAHLSGARVEQVTGVLDYEQVRRAIRVEPELYKYYDRHLTVLVPAAGEGRRFQEAGFKDPKPFIRMPNHLTMLESSVDSLQVEANVVVVTQKKWQERVELDWGDRYDFSCVYVDGPTPGSLSTCLAGLREYWYGEGRAEPLVIANSDQVIEWDATSFWYTCTQTKLDGLIVVFPETEHDPKWSYSQVENGLVTRVAEKEAISGWANCGVFWWRTAADFLKYGQLVVQKNRRVKGEFYVSTVLDEMIADGKKIGIFPVKKMWGTGVPSDLAAYLEHRKNKLLL